MRVLVLILAAGLTLAGCGQQGARPAAEQAGAAKAGGGCAGFDPKLSPEENAARASAFIDNEAMEKEQREGIIKEVAATLKAFPAWAPVHPCGVGLSADSPPDGSGVLQLTYSLEGDAAAVAKFYADAFQGHGEVSSIVEQGPGPVVHTVNLVSAAGNIDVHVQDFPPEDGKKQPLSIALRGEGLPN